MNELENDEDTYIHHQPQEEPVLDVLGRYISPNYHE